METGEEDCVPIDYLTNNLCLRYELGLYIKTSLFISLLVSKLLSNPREQWGASPWLHALKVPKK